jgi:hypothetical protein
MTEQIKLTKDDMGIWHDKVWCFEINSEKADSEQDMEEIRKQILENQEIVDGIISEFKKYQAFREFLLLLFLQILSKKLQVKTSRECIGICGRYETTYNRGAYNI